MIYLHVAPSHPHPQPTLPPAVTSAHVHTYTLTKLKRTHYSDTIRLGTLSTTGPNEEKQLFDTVVSFCSVLLIYIVAFFLKHPYKTFPAAPVNQPGHSWVFFSQRERFKFPEDFHHWLPKCSQKNSIFHLKSKCVDLVLCFKYLKCTAFRQIICSIVLIINLTWLVVQKYCFLGTGGSKAAWVNHQVTLHFQFKENYFSTKPRNQPNHRISKGLWLISASFKVYYNINWYICLHMLKFTGTCCRSFAIIY